MGALNNIRIECTALSGKIVLARFGKDKSVALETRPAMGEFLSALLSYSFDGKKPEPGKSVEISFGSDPDEQYVMTIKRKEPK